CGGAWSRFHALEPGSEVLVRRIEGLADSLHEVEESKQQNISHGELVADDERLGTHQPVKPSEALSCRRLQVVGSLRDAVDAVLKHLEAFGEAEAIGRRLANVEVDAARPHAGHGALLG